MGMGVKGERVGEEGEEEEEEVDLQQSAQCYFGVFFYSYMYLWYFILAAVGFCSCSSERDC